jgi:hypothetical protein
MSTPRLLTWSATGEVIGWIVAELDRSEIKKESSFFVRFFPTSDLPNSDKTIPGELMVISFGGSRFDFLQDRRQIIWIESHSSLGISAVAAKSPHRCGQNTRSYFLDCFADSKSIVAAVDGVVGWEHSKEGLSND